MLTPPLRSSAPSKQLARFRRFLRQTMHSLLPSSSSSSSSSVLPLSAGGSNHSVSRSTNTIIAVLLGLCLLLAWAPWHSCLNSPVNSDSGVGVRLPPAASSLSSLAAASASANGPNDSDLSAALPNESGDDGLELSDASDSSPLAHLTHLVLVAGHAVLTGTDVHSLLDKRNWYLQSYQVGQLDTFVEHMRAGVRLARQDPQALLVFSGGETRSQAGPRSEAQGYWIAANHARWFADDDKTAVGSSTSPILTSSSSTSAATTGAAAATADTMEEPVDEVSLRATTEEFSRDSFENLLFSLCRFREVTGAYPAKVTVVGFSFKAPRFRDLHRAAVRFPIDRYEYIGIDPPMMQMMQGGSEEEAGSSSPDAAKARAEQAEAARAALLASEQTNSYRPFLSDPYSCHAPLLLKKASRNPFRRSHSGYEHGCPEMRSLLRHCGRSIFEGALPWDPKGVELRRSQDSQREWDSLIQQDKQQQQQQKLQQLPQQPPQRQQLQLHGEPKADT
jgi:hypothetical protein